MAREVVLDANVIVVAWLDGADVLAARARELMDMTMRYAHLAPSGDADLLATLDAGAAAAPRAIERRSS